MDEAVQGEAIAMRGSGTVKQLISSVVLGQPSDMQGERSGVTRTYLGRNPSTMPEETAALVTFVGHEELLRGSGLTALLRRGAAAYANSTGDARTFSLSQPVKFIQFFISHNWCVPRWKKYIALAIQFNFDLSLSTMLACWTCVAALIAAEVLPVFVRPNWGLAAMWGQWLCAPVFIITLLFVRDLMHCLGHRGRATFLDKTCIAQADAKMQAEGIARLGAFVNHSEYLVALYTNDTYLHKLWTVFEMAAFVCLHPTNRLIVLPVSKAVLLFYALVLAYAYQVTNSILWLFRPVPYFQEIAGLCLGMAFSFAHRVWAKECHVMLQSVASFSVHKCTCHCPDDRPLVYRNIAALMRASGFVEPHTEEAAALEAFDELVRTEVLVRAITCAGKRAFTYKQYMGLSFIIAGTTLLDTLGLHVAGLGGPGGRVALLWALLWCYWLFAGWIFTFVMLETLVSTRLHLVGWRDLLWTVLMVFTAAIPIIGVSLVVRTLVDMGEDGSDVVFVPLITMVLVGAAAAYWVCRPPATGGAALGGRGLGAPQARHSSSALAAAEGREPERGPSAAVSSASPAREVAMETVLQTWV